MWMVVMFDLPVVTKAQKQQYQRFVRFLKQDGYMRLQYSVYMRFCVTTDLLAVHNKRLVEHMPCEGMVTVVEITDKQFGRMRHYIGEIEKPKKPPKIPQANSQLEMF
jgi:CRISPR-associated protein Cas2